MKIVVTGATGGLGRTACEMLLSRGVQVHATGRQADKLADLVAQGLQFTALDLVQADAETLSAVLEGADAVWHCAALSSPWGRKEEFFQCNVVATEKLLDAAFEARVPRFIHVSTPALYFDYQHHLGIPESFLAKSFVNEYAATKYQAELSVERIARRGGIRAVALRPRALFGPRDQVLIPRLLRAAREHGGKLPLPGGGRTVLDLTYIDNVVQAMWLATEADHLGAYQVFNITNGEPQRLCDVLTHLSEELGKPFVLKSLPYPLLAGVARLMEAKAAITGKEPALTRYSVGALAFDMTLDIGRARKLLGYTPTVSMSEGLARTVNALRSQGVR